MPIFSLPFKKRHPLLRFLLYLPLTLVIILFIIAQSGCLTMRTADQAWPEKLQQAGQPMPASFTDLPAKNGRRIHMIGETAMEALPLVVLVHGSPGSADAYATYLGDTVLTQKLRLLAIDRPGFGYTEKFGKPETSLAVQADALWTAVQHFSPHRKVMLVGHSLGGPVICRFAMDHPEAVAGLVIVAGSIDPTQEEHPWWQAAIDVPPLKWLTPKSLWTSNREIKALEGELHLMMPMWDKITCPVRVIHAQDDKLVQVENAHFAQRMLVNCPDLQMQILPEGNHFILWNHYPVIRNTILELAEKVDFNGL